ncbi:hypothetical protein HYY72_05065 [Candidatus Woesearchaeota archaeon]|nr:hypothetical protein [Candidatus Woesearchaeota archaeon]
MSILQLPKFDGILKEDSGQISIDNAVFILDREYGITHADDERPVLTTEDILGFLETGCTGILFYDPDIRLGSLTHLYHNDRFSETVEEVLRHMTVYGSRRHRGHIIRPSENPKIRDPLLETQRSLLESGKLVSPFELFPEQAVVFDTRDGRFSKRPSGLYFPSIESRPYGNRIIREGNVVYTNPAPMSCCYEPKKIPEPSPK